VNALENRIPPPIVALLTGLAMWGLSKRLSGHSVAPRWHFALTLALRLVALAFAVPAMLAFRRARTTISPVQIDEVSRVVTGGIFRVTRNPMYVGLTVLLGSWAAYLAQPTLLLGPLAFALFTHRFQILPEERAMESKFGGEYLAYKQKVPRWLLV
jgi:protein-S-isoprenylcysteine O-methyltransferase Ste14